MEDAIDNTDSSIVVSTLGIESAALYEHDLSIGRSVFSTAVPNRERRDVAIYNGYVSPKQLGEYYKLDTPGKIVSTGGAVSSMIAIALAPLHKKLDINKLRIETLQSLEEELAEWQPKGIATLVNDDERQLKVEINKFLGRIGEPHDAQIFTRTNSDDTLRTGHHASIKMTTDKQTSIKEIEGLWKGYKAPARLKRLQYGDHNPRRHPIKVKDETLATWEDFSNLHLRYKPSAMRVHGYVREIEKSDKRMSHIEVSADKRLVAGLLMMNIGQALVEGLVKP